MSDKKKPADFKFEIQKSIGVLGTSSSGWRKEFNLLSWNGRQSKYDLREWNPEHTSMSKGVTMTGAEARELCRLLNLEFDDSQDQDADQSSSLFDEDDEQDQTPFLEASGQ